MVLLASDRVVLLIRHRVMLQTAHRLTGLLAVACLAVHIVRKVAEGHAAVVDVFVPFVSANQRLFIGFGTIASYVMGVLVWTGLIPGGAAPVPLSDDEFWRHMRGGDTVP